MDLTLIWEQFLEEIRKVIDDVSIEYRKVAGIPFVYIRTNITQEQLEKLMKISSAKVMRGKRLHSETIFVRKSENLYVYRHRFLVPQEKMFCCGNSCADCIRFSHNN